MWWLYTSVETAQATINQLNDNIHTFNPNINFADEPTMLTANPEILGITYICGFPAPNPNLRFNGVSCDLEIEYNENWFLIEEF